MSKITSDNSHLSPDVPIIKPPQASKVLNAHSSSLAQHPLQQSCDNSVTMDQNGSDGFQTGINDSLLTVINSEQGLSKPGFPRDSNILLSNNNLVWTPGATQPDRQNSTPKTIYDKPFLGELFQAFKDGPGSLKRQFGSCEIEHNASSSEETFETHDTKKQHTYNSSSSRDEDEPVM
ncbi:unnamed protein product [Didymodactylos carnosus]|uniref:Uncharacterized protein n=1 Tax=Didymodactylos carnosus TaxID=1234261 RepID=A0A815YSD8_9BILA|nr:unnamed protein product [Didymodactylos carnosus]CAF4439214.1 unnamed protein product [Didymodactylos carnosus]